MYIHGILLMSGVIVLKPKTIAFLRKTQIGSRMLDDSRYRLVMTATLSFIINIVYAVYHGVLGVIDGSWWFVTMSAYYAMLSVMRMYVVLHERKKKNDERKVMRIAGVFLLLLSWVLAGSVVLNAVHDVSKSHHEIVMITIALYTTIKVTLAIMNAVKARQTHSLFFITLRNISCADAAASVVSLQRSMFASFGDVTGADVFIMNIATGTAAFIIVLIMGIFMIAAKKKKAHEQSQVKNKQ